MAADSAAGSKRKHDEMEASSSEGTGSNFIDMFTIGTGGFGDIPTQDFVCHKDILFRRALGLKSIKHKSNFTYVGGDPLCVKVYLEYIYRPKTTDLVKSLARFHGAKQEKMSTITDLVIAWKLGDFLKDSDFQNACMDALLRQQPTNADFDILAVHKSWQGVPANSKMRDWIEDTMVHCMDRKDAFVITDKAEKEKLWKSLSGSLLFKLIEIVAAEERVRMPTILDREKYHVKTKA